MEDYSIGRNNFNEEREIPITPSKYVNARLKCCDDRFADLVHFAERKRILSEFSVCQLVNHDKLRRMISDDQIFSSFKNIIKTSQFIHNMLLNVRGKTRQFGVCTFFLSCSAAEFHWTEIIQVVACQYGQTLTDKQVN